ncbi:MAG: hypothetical protein Q8Q54_15775 [Methylococcales bacterium]|nr:hypothetical protein [Methylococcales bacterium]MDP3840376.1 hypothetical protein [Methylococcales bacterium]
MNDKIRVGDSVKLIDLPHWLIHDLPESEQTEMREFIGQQTIVREIDSYGYFWLEFEVIVEKNDTNHCCGHSFAVSHDFIDLVTPYV